MSDAALASSKSTTLCGLDEVCRDVARLGGLQPRRNRWLLEEIESNSGGSQANVISTVSLKQVVATSRHYGYMTDLFTVPTRKKDWPKFIADRLEIPVTMGSDGPWRSRSDTITREWFIAMCEALDIPYEGKVKAMQSLILAVGEAWDPVTMASTVTASTGGGNIQKAAFIALWRGMLESPRAHIATAMNRAVVGDPDSQPIDRLPSRDRILRSILTRRGQRYFRASVLKAYGYRCAVTGSDLIETLEAAHIRGHADGGAMVVTNGLLLRADVHTLFDLNLMAIDTSTWTTIVASRLLASGSGRGLAGASIRLPVSPRDWPDVQALDEQRERAGL